MKPLVIFAPVLSLFLLGCQRQPEPTLTVCLLDISRSITPEGIQYEFKAMDEMVDGMGRGNRLTIIPITGNAASETPGRILHLDAPLHREPYDHDLVAFRQQARAQIAAMREMAIAHPSNRTDILGTLYIATQEFTKSKQRILIVYSDFIEDDQVYRFTRDPSMASEANAREFAQLLKKQLALDYSGVHIRQMHLPSADLQNLRPQRQQAIRLFWNEYFSTSPTALP